MSTESNKQKVIEFWKYFSAADQEAALKLLDEDAVWQAMGRDGGLPLSGKMNKSEIGDLIKNVKAGIPEGLALTATGWTAEGDRVAVEMESYGVKTDGKIYNNLYHFMIEFKNGKIIQIKEYMDTLHVKEIFMS